jgi:hypothetical protein
MSSYPPQNPPPYPPQQPYYPQQPPPNIPNYLAQAILCTLFCCLPFGIVAIVFAAQVNGRLAMGDYAGASQLSGQARTWCWVAFACGLIGIVLYFGFVIMAVMSGEMRGMH